jgi:hypothetical protein
VTTENQNPSRQETRRHNQKEPHQPLTRGAPDLRRRFCLLSRRRRRRLLWCLLLLGSGRLLGRRSLLLRLGLGSGLADATRLGLAQRSLLARSLLAGSGLLGSSLLRGGGLLGRGLLLGLLAVLLGGSLLLGSGLLRGSLLLLGLLALLGLLLGGLLLGGGLLGRVLLGKLDTTRGAWLGLAWNKKSSERRRRLTLRLGEDALLDTQLQRLVEEGIEHVVVDIDGVVGLDILLDGLAAARYVSDMVLVMTWQLCCVWRGGTETVFVLTVA